MLNGTGSRFVSSFVVPQGIPGGALCLTVLAVPTNTTTGYPANGELLSAFLLGTAAQGGLADGRIKIPSGVRPDSGSIEDNLGHSWVLDPAIGTMGALRNWTSVGATPSEHSTGNYSGNETTSLIRITLYFPLYGDMSR